MKFEGALINTSIGWYELASYNIEEKNGTFSKVHLHFNDFVTIYEQDHEESYAVIRGIFQHKGNNKKYYVFVVVDWFENTEREHPLLKCPLYRLQIRNQWRRIFPISVIDNVQKYILFTIVTRKDAEIVIMMILIEIGSKIVFILQLYNFILLYLYCDNDV